MPRWGRPFACQSGPSTGDWIDKRLLLLVVCCMGGLGLFVTAKDATTSSNRDTTMAVADTFSLFARPVLEILYPQNGDVLDQTDLEIEITIRDKTLRNELENPQVCIGMNASVIPHGVQLEEGTSQLKETCFEQQIRNVTTFHVAGLMPGLSYGVKVGLMNAGKTVGMSMRHFQVGSIDIPGTNLKMSVAGALETAVQLHQASMADRVRAVRIYEDVLAIFPNHLHAKHLLGLALYQDGHVLEAIPYIQQALDGNSSNEHFHNSLGLCLKQIGKTDEAIAHFRKALELRPTCVEANLNLGDAFQHLSQWDDALAEYRKVIATCNAEISHAKTHRIMSSAADPAASFDQIARDATGRICELTRVQDGWYAAEKCFEEAIDRWPNEIQFRLDKGSLLSQAGAYREALDEYRIATELGSLVGMLNYADIWESLGETEKSIAQYEKLLKFIREKQYPTTKVMILKATALPRILPSSQEEIDEIRVRLESEIDFLLENVDTLESDRYDPNHLMFSSVILLNSHNRNNRDLKRKIATLYQSFIAKKVLIEEYMTRYKIVPPPYRQTIHMPSKNATSKNEKRLRIGFVSRFMVNPNAELYMHELIPRLNTSKYDIKVFVVGQSKSTRVLEQVDQIAETVIALPIDLRVARNEIRAAELDVLIFPEIGMDKTTFFLSLERFAPVQAAWWANPDTTGVPTIDYYLTSEYEVDGHEQHYSEQVYQFKGMGIYHKPDQLLSPLDEDNIKRIRSQLVTRFSLPANFHMFLCIESVLNFHPDFDAMIDLLFTVDKKAHVFLFIARNREDWHQQLLHRLEARLGKETLARRVLFLINVDEQQELSLLQVADAVIGSIHLTRPRAILQAFAAGVPVVTLPGKLWSSRIAYGFYQQMNMQELIAKDIKHFVTIAFRLASDALFRQKMRQKIADRRHLLYERKDVLKQWETFFEFAGDLVHKSDFKSPTAKDSSGEDTSSTSTFDSSNMCTSRSLTNKRKNTCSWAEAGTDFDFVS